MSPVRAELGRVSSCGLHDVRHEIQHQLSNTIESLGLPHDRPDGNPRQYPTPRHGETNAVLRWLRGRCSHNTAHHASLRAVQFIGFTRTS